MLCQEVLVQNVRFEGLGLKELAELFFFCDQDLAHDASQDITALSRSLDIVHRILKKTWHSYATTPCAPHRQWSQ